MRPARTILLLAPDNDDTAVLRFVLGNSLPRYDVCMYKITSVSTKRQALYKLLTGHYDLLLILSPFAPLRSLMVRAKLIDKWMPVLVVGGCSKPTMMDLIERIGIMTTPKRGPKKGSPSAMRCGHNKKKPVVSVATVIQAEDVAA